jgi:pyruvate-ferredoxin/flavodoxin oxidoreductase
LTPTVFHVAARSLATHALSIFGDHSDVMAVRGAGWAMLASHTVQEAHDMALIAQAATLRSRVPVLHFFDGFRTSHEVNKIAWLADEQLRAMLDEELVREFRRRSLDPDRPLLRGTAQNPDVFFQAREAANPYYAAAPSIFQETMDRFAAVAGRSYRLFDYVGAPDADRVLVLMGSGTGAADEAANALRGAGESVGVLKVRLYRPFDAAAFVAALPRTVRRLGVLDRSKEPGSAGEPLYLDVVAAVCEAWPADLPRPEVFGGRYGLSSKEFTPAMAAGIYAELAGAAPRRHFTAGINDDVTGLSVAWDREFSTEAEDVTRAVFYGLGSDGTVGASKNTVKIIGENTPLFAQGYFVYDSKKAGSITVSHVRVSPRPIESTYLITRANFVACHQPQFFDRIDVLETAQPGATFLLNCPFAPAEAWDSLPREIQETILAKNLRFFVIDAYRVAQEAGLGGRINAIMQTCFFALSAILPREEAIAQIKHAIEKTYGRRGEAVLARNYAAVDATLAALHAAPIPAQATSDRRRTPFLSATHPSTFIQRVTTAMLEGRGDRLPVSALPVDGAFPTGTARLEKRSIAQEIPLWEPDLCIQCGLCALVCPHAAIRMKAFPAACVAGAPEGFATRPWKAKDLPDHRMAIQVAPDDCTGCGVCVDECPARSKEAVKDKAINMRSQRAHLTAERIKWEFFDGLPEVDRTAISHDTVKTTQLLQPLFEFSGACAGCGETPYLKLLSQLFGDRALVANATGCSSIYGGNLPTTPWTANAEGRGPAWCNSLFEDNAEFGLGMRLALDARHALAADLVRQLAGEVGDDLATELLEAAQTSDAEIAAQRRRVADLQRRLARSADPRARALEPLAASLVRRTVWIVGGDGWAYDIGFGGLDHVFTTGRDVNVLVLDTGVYSNTGGQASKATPRGAVAKFAASGKTARKKDLGMLAIAYGNVYVAQIALGANPQQTVKAFLEAESYPGPSLILAYSQCIAHGIEMTTGMTHQKDAVNCGFWPIYRYDPRLARHAGHPLRLDCRKPSQQFKDFAAQEGRFAMLARTSPEAAERLLALAQRDIDDQWSFYEQMAGVDREID